MTSNLWQKIDSYQIEYQYNGEETKYCDGCSKIIEEGDKVVIEVYENSDGKRIVDRYHEECYDDSE